MSNEDTHGTGSGVSRRTFIKAAGASGAVVSLAGCQGGQQTTTEGGDGGGGGGETTTTTSEQSEQTVLQLSYNSRMKKNQAGLNEALHTAGMPDDITIQIIAGSQTRSKYQQWLGAKRAQPDLLTMDSGWTVPFIVRDQTWNLSENLSDSLLNRLESDWFDMSLSSAKDPRTGDIHGVPLFPDFPTMQYRKDLLRQAGYSSSDFEQWKSDPPKWKEFSQITRQVMDTEGVDVTYGFSFQANKYVGLPCCDFNEFMTSWGGAYFGDPSENLFGPVGDRPVTVDEQQVINSIKMIKSFIHGPDAEDTLDGYQNISPQAVLQWEEESSRKPFTAGDAVMHRNWPYSISINGNEENFGEDLGVMPIPYAKSASEADYPRTGGPVAALGGWNLVINPFTEKKDAAVEALKAFMSEEHHMWAIETVGHLPPEPDLFTSQRAQDVPVMGRYLEQLQTAGKNAIARPVTVAWPQQSDRIAQQVNSAYAGDKTASDAMATLADQLESIENSVQ